jgi:hypothetical protein
MSAALRHLCDCLWWALERRGPVESAPPQWDLWLSLAEEHKLGAFLYRRLRGRATWPEHVRAALAAHYMSSAIANGLRLREQVRLIAQLGSVASCMMLKGVVLALTKYAEPAERDMSDMDVFCPSREDADAAIELLRTNGYVPMRAIPGHHHLPIMRHRTGRLSVEVHTNLTTPGLGSEFLTRFFADRARITLPGGCECAVPDRVHALFHHCLHTLKDPIESPLLRNLFEIAWMASDFTAEDWANFARVAESSGRDEVARRALALACDYFPVHMMPFKRPLPGSIEFWARRRLGWIEGSLGIAARILRHIGVKHFDRMPTGRLLTDSFDVARVAVVSVRNALVGRLKSRAAPYRAAPLRCAPVCEEPLDEHIALLDPTSGRVSVLRGPAAEAWRCASAEESGRAIVRRLAAAGVSRPDARAAVRALAAQGLLISQK